MTKGILTALALAYEPTIIPVTPDLKVSIEHFIGSSIAVCKKNNIDEDTCADQANQKALMMRKSVDEICTKHFPDRLVSCQQTGATLGFQKMVQENVYKLSLRLT
ncbi:MAG TPA: hypothetical protein PLE82_00070 [Saccharofermentans sp.]|nr:hypothetical protein [Saccharofermentans sp.]